jgi:hypothetical protein
MRIPLFLMLSLSAGLGSSALAAALSEAEFTRVINDVKILPAEAGPLPAKPGDRISGRTAVSTGVQSRAELRFPDKTLTRLGANSVFRMDPTSRTVDLDKGVILLQVPKQMGGARVRTAAVTAAVTGTTALVEYTPDGYIKIIVIEGEVDVFLNERRGTFRTLVPGDMWITRANDKTGLPLPVQVDLERLQKTSKLLNAEEFAPLGNQKQVVDALNGQSRKKLEGELMNTSFQIEGRGRNVTLTQGERQHVLGVAGSNPVRRPTPATQTRTERTATATAASSVSGPNQPVNVPGTTLFDNNSILPATPGAKAFNSITGTVEELPGSVYLPAQDGPFGDYMFGAPQSFPGLDAVLSARPAWTVFKGDEISIAGNPVVEPGIDSRNLILGSTGDFNFTSDPSLVQSGLAVGDRWALDGNTGALVVVSQNGSVNFDSFDLTGTTQEVGFYADGIASDAHLGGTLSPSLIRLPAGSFEASAGRDVMVSASTIEAKTIKLAAGRDIRLGSPAGGSAQLGGSGEIRLQAQQNIIISNSSQLRRLAQLDNTQVWLEAVNGNLEMIEGSSIDADVVNLSSMRGDLRLLDSTIAAREIKARVFDTGGTLLLSNAILGRGSNPSDLIRLSGEGAGGVRFVGATTLRGNVVDIAGKSVRIDSGSRVLLANPGGTTVYADAHLFNNGANGNFTGLSGSQTGGGPVEVIKKPYAGRPGF